MLTIHENATSFLAIAQVDLERHEVANGLMLGIALGLQRNPARIAAQPFLATVLDERGLAAAAVMTPPYHLVVYSNRTDPSPAFDLIAQALVKQGWRPDGVNGPNPGSAQFAARWRKATGQSATVVMRLRAFELRTVTPPPAVPGFLRQATLADLALVERWAHAFIVEAVPEELAHSSPDATRRRLEEGSIFLWEHDGAVLSMAGQARPLPHGMSVNLVYTPPELRSRGLASACVAALSQQLLDAGWDYCTLFTDLSNPISNSIYQRIGYRPVCDYLDHAFGIGE